MKKKKSTAKSKKQRSILAKNAVVLSVHSGLYKMIGSPGFQKNVINFIDAQGKISKKAIIKLFNKNKPLGLSKKKWDDIVCCFIYDLYHAFKHTAAASKLFFEGKKFRTLEYNVKVKGCVIKVEGFDEIDGDFNFDIITDSGEQLHCEITPCNRSSLKKFIDELLKLKEKVNNKKESPKVELAG